MTMDERAWKRAQSLASSFGVVRNEDVAVVLGEALLEALAELLVPEDERDFGSLTGPEQQAVRDAEVDVDAEIGCGSTSIDGHECSKPDGHEGYHRSDSGVCWQGLLDQPREMSEAKAQHPAFIPQFLEGAAAYEAAPVGTEAICTDASHHNCASLVKGKDGWSSKGSPWPSPLNRRLVRRWGQIA